MFELEIIKPSLSDVERIYELVSYFSKKGEILSRSRENIAERIREFNCARVSDNIIGISSLRIYYPFLAEIRTIVIDEKFQGRGVGRKLVEACIEEAKVLGVKDVFALTFKKGFFVKLGFKAIDKKELPSKKIWEDCINCPLFPNCSEEAVIYSLF